MKKDNLIFNDIKLGVKRDYARCECGHKIPYKNFNVMGWGVCYVCGGRVEKPKNIFKTKIFSLIQSRMRGNDERC